MGRAIQLERLSRGGWTLAHYLAERSRAPMPQVVGLHDNILDAARVAVTFPIPRTIYVLNESGELLGMIPAERLASSIFDVLDNSPLGTDSHTGFDTHVFIWWEL